MTRAPEPRDGGAQRSVAAVGIDLSDGDIAAYLRDRGVAPAGAEITIQSLAGGISNDVVRAAWEGECVVLKQSLGHLRVAAEWAFDRARIFNERDCLEVLGKLLPGAAPSVVFSDDESFLFGMTCAPPGGHIWKQAKLHGAIDPLTAPRAGSLIGRLQAAAAGSAELARRFAALWPLEQGRLEPYHKTVARRHPELAPIIHAETDRVRSTRRTLVHGDFSPKNIIVYPDRLLVLDCEVAHWGDPAFDPAFLMTHLLLAGVYRPALNEQFLAQTAAFWAAYQQAAGGLTAPEADVVAELGCLLLARVDGKSPVEYLTTDSQHEHVRRLGRTILIEPPSGVAELLELVEREARRWNASNR